MEFFLAFIGNLVLSWLIKIRSIYMNKFGIACIMTSALKACKF